jgi:hypothetical protein
VKNLSTLTDTGHAKFLSEKTAVLFGIDHRQKILNALDFRLRTVTVPF